MRIVEIRDLDGPNLFLDSPAIKVELGEIEPDEMHGVMDTLQGHVRHLHTASGADLPEITSKRMDAPGQVSVAFGWTRRSFGKALGKRAAQLTTGERTDLEQIVSELREILQREREEDDAPQLIRPEDRNIPIIAITGTNGKTTTSRLISFVLRFAGNKVGLTSSAGVFINTEMVLKGDYSGPSGAHRVFEEPGVDYAVLETARGGMLLRGCGFLAADVAVVTNVTDDHLGLHGIFTLDGLAEVKSIIARNVKRGGFCVLNADDARVRAMAEITPGIPVLFSRDPNSPSMAGHLASGGSGLQVNARGEIVWIHQGEPTVITNVSDIPMTFGGRAGHQVENALAATGALLGLDIPVETIRDGLRAFRSSAEDSKGRLNVYTVNGATVIMDFAHNEAGLVNLLNFGRSMVKPGGRLISVVGTAGDRDDQALRGIGKRAVEMADVVVLKDSVHYLRGREPGEMLDVMREGTRMADRQEVEVMNAPDERTATLQMVETLTPNDVLAVMCIEDYDYLLPEMGRRGTPQV